MLSYVIFKLKEKHLLRWKLVYKISEEKNQKIEHFNKSADYQVQITKCKNQKIEAPALD